MESLLAWREFKSRQNFSERYGLRRASSSLKSSYMDLPLPERVASIAFLRFTELKAKAKKGFATADQYDNFICEKDLWFSWLKDAMRINRISKETLAASGLDWKECKSFAYSCQGV